VLLLGLLLVSGGFSGCEFRGMQDLPLPGSPDVGDESYAVTAEFTDVLSLAEDSTVKLDGVTVGRGESVGRDGWHAAVTLRLRGDVRLPGDVRARVAQTSLLGEKYVDLEVPADGGSGRLAGGDRIALADTGRGREVEEVLGALSLLLNGGGLGQLHTITTELDDALSDPGTTRGFLRELDRFVTLLDDNRSTIVSALENVDRLAGQVARNRRVVERAIDDIAPAVRRLAQQRRALVGMLGSLDRFSQVASSVVRTSAADLEADLRALRPVLAQLNRSGRDLPRVIETVLSFPFPDEVLNAVKGDYVNLDVLMDLSPLVILGNATGDGERLQDLPPRPLRAPR
jgi:phospholipid/cholesterol/gamma-HCH transport system substrate-binding protein